MYAYKYLLLACVIPLTHLINLLSEDTNSDGKWANFRIRSENQFTLLICWKLFTGQQLWCCFDHIQVGLVQHTKASIVSITAKKEEVSIAENAKNSGKSWQFFFYKCFSFHELLHLPDIYQESFNFDSSWEKYFVKSCNKLMTCSFNNCIVAYANHEKIVWSVDFSLFSFCSHQKQRQKQKKSVSICKLAEINDCFDLNCNVVIVTHTHTYTTA